MKNKTYDGMIIQDNKCILNIEITAKKREIKEETEKVEE